MEQDSSDLGSLLALARLEQATGRLEQAIEYARRYIQARPEDLAGNLLLGDLLTHAGRPAEARLQFEQAQLLDDPPVESTLRLVALAAREGEWSEARALLAEARAIGNSPLHASQVLASEVALEVRLGRIEKAIELIGDLHEYNRQLLPPMEQVFNYYVPTAQFFMMLGRLDQAESVLQEAQASIQPPLNQFLSFIEVVLRSRQGDIASAEAALQQGIDALERFKAEYLTFQVSIAGAEIARAQGDHARAGALYAESIERARSSPVDKGIAGELTSLYAESARQYVKAGDLKSARTLLDRAFERDEGEPTLWVARAMLQRASGDTGMALASINYALAIWQNADPDYVENREALALRDELSAEVAR
jgi:tetratricopeptide (TPR) repeat protein